jgi:hypothetical protein
MRYYAGIGARNTPAEVLALMSNIGKNLSLEGMTLRSGGAKGADLAFEIGASTEGGPCEIFLAKHSTPAAEDLAGLYHPNWGACRPYVRSLHGRNSMILMGENLDTPVDFVVCWTPEGVITGGTGQSIRMAQGLEITVVNLAVQEWVLPPIQAKLNLA